jgi:hypothetical protein
MPDTVRVYDPDTGRTVTIPARELAPGMVQVEREGEGLVWVPEATLKAGPIRHSEMPGLRPLFRRLSETFAAVHPVTPERWEDGFRRDRDPTKELKIWVLLADAYLHFAGRVTSADGRRDLFRLLLACANNGRDHALTTVRLTALSRRRADEVIDYMFRPLSGEEAVAMLERFMAGDAAP